MKGDAGRVSVAVKVFLFRRVLQLLPSSRSLIKKATIACFRDCTGRHIDRFKIASALCPSDEQLPFRAFLFLAPEFRSECARRLEIRQSA